MGRPLRYGPDGTVVEIIYETYEDQPLLADAPGRRAMLARVIARATALTGVSLHAFDVSPTRLRLLVTQRPGEPLAKFLSQVGGNTSRGLRSGPERPARVWRRRGHLMPLADDESPEARFATFLAPLRGEDGRWMSSGEHPEGVLEATWIDRSRRGAGPKQIDYRIELAPIPAWRPLAVDEQAARRAELARRNVPARIGDRWPMLFAVDPVLGEGFRQRWMQATGLHRRASQRLRRGLRATFPAGCYPPAGPFKPLPLEVQPHEPPPRGGHSLRGYSSRGPRRRPGVPAVPAHSRR